MKKKSLEHVVEINTSKKQLKVNGNSMDLGDNFKGARASVQKPGDLAIDLRYAPKPGFSQEEKQEDISLFLEENYPSTLDVMSYSPDDFQEEIKETGSYHAISLVGHFEAYIH